LTRTIVLKLLKKI